MPPDSRDVAYLWDMLESAKAILRFTEHSTLETFVADELLRSAVERQLILIGEAARRVSDAFRAAHPEVPWREMVGQRSVLVHDYGEISPELIWRVVDEDLQPLIGRLTMLLAGHPPPL